MRSIHYTYESESFHHPITPYPRDLAAPLAHLLHFVTSPFFRGGTNEAFLPRFRPFLPWRLIGNYVPEWVFNVGRSG
jgi:hypothetical protein